MLVFASFLQPPSPIVHSGKKADKSATTKKILRQGIPAKILSPLTDGIRSRGALRHRSKFVLSPRRPTMFVTDFVIVFLIRRSMFVSTHPRIHAAIFCLLCLATWNAPRPVAAQNSSANDRTFLPNPKSEADEKENRRRQLRNSSRILFLGDSITYSGQYIACFERWLITQKEMSATVINAGLPSETVSGLSEKGHAGGKFPRPIWPNGSIAFSR